MPYSKQCPYCGEALRPDEATQTVRCDACGAELAPGELRTQAEEELLALLNEPAKETAGLGGFVCENCGAQLIAEESAASAFCCFCGAPALAPEAIEDVPVPELILPFAVDRREAQERFVHRFNKKKLISPGFLEAARAGRFSGLYVPFWLFDCEVETHLHALSTETETERSDRKEDVTVRRFRHYRHVTATFSAVPADASERVDGRLMSLLGPFDLSGLEPFDPAAAADFYTEKNSFSAEQAFLRAREEIEAVALKAARDALNTQSYAEVKSCRHLYQSLGAKYALLPVWLLNCREDGYTHQFFMNGQTGKIVGEAPLSLPRALRWFGGVAAGVTVAGELIWLAANRLL